MFTPKCYLIHCQTNLHAGSGDTNYGIIDKMIQRDPVLELPCIFSSSLKGALREYFEEGPESELLRPFADPIFGKKNNVEAEATDNQKGNTIFHEAQLIGLPMRSNMKPYFIATSKYTLLSWLQKAELFGLPYPALNAEINALPDIDKGSPKIAGSNMTGLMIEDFENVSNFNAAVPILYSLLGANILLMHHDDFKEQCSNYNLPVIARNSLQNGESKNLWYEQIVSHQSRFAFFTVSIETDEFANRIEGRTVQIGANSSLGYGYCKITQIIQS